MSDQSPDHAPPPPFRRNWRQTLRRYVTGCCLIAVGMAAWIAAILRVWWMPEPVWVIAVLLIFMGVTALTSQSYTAADG